jgi:molecular chaperone IbpA
MTNVGRISFGPLHSSVLGFEKIFQDVEKLLDTDFKVNKQTFPPHNIIKVHDNHYIVEMAIAGFSKNQIEITVQDGVLTVRGTTLPDPDEEHLTYLHRGIGTRSFTKTIRIADTIEVVDAEYNDGILRIGLENIIPEHKKPKKIQIGGPGQLSLSKSELLLEESENV